MSDDVESIKRDIAATRARLHASVDALAYRANVPARAKEAVDAKIGSVKDSLAGALGRGRIRLAAVAERADAGSDDTRARMLSMAASVSQRVAAVRETLGEPLAHARDIVPAPSLPKGNSPFMQAFLARNPLGFALTAVAAGLLIGFVLPISNLERDTVGPVGQQLIDDATAAAGDAIEHGKAVVATIVGDA